MVCVCAQTAAAEFWVDSTHRGPGSTLDLTGNFTNFGAQGRSDPKSRGLEACVARRRGSDAGRVRAWMHGLCTGVPLEHALPGSRNLCTDVRPYLCLGSHRQTGGRHVVMGASSPQPYAAMDRVLASVAGVVVGHFWGFHVASGFRVSDRWSGMLLALRCPARRYEWHRGSSEQGSGCVGQTSATAMGSRNI